MQISQLLSQFPTGKTSTESVWVNNAVLVMREFGYTVEEMRVMPVPTFITLLEQLRKESDRQEREMKKGRKR